MIAQLFNALASRSERATAFRGLTSNRLLLLAIGLSALLQVAVVHLPLLQSAFGTTSLTGAEWARCLAAGSAVLWAEELRKWRARRHRPSTATDVSLAGHGDLRP